MRSDQLVKKELLALLDGGNAHMTFEEAIEGFPPEHINSKPPNTPYSFWHLAEHIRIAQWDILEFIRNPGHVSPSYPEGYRPHTDEKTDTSGWRATVEQTGADLEALKNIVLDGKTGLFAPLRHAPGYTVLREIMLVADHTAYHVGEIAILRQVMAIWPKGKEYLTGRP